MIRYVYICSPYRGDTKANVRAAQRYCRATIADYPGDIVIPFAPHLYFPQFLDDGDPEQREAGLNYGLALLRWMARSKAAVSVRQFGETISPGMVAELELADQLELHIEHLPADYGLKRPRPKKQDDPAFEKFWDAYPYKIKKDAARAAWRRLDPCPAQVDAIMSRLAMWARSWDWRKEDGRYVPHPASWLNGAMYDALPRQMDPPKQGTGRTYHYTDYTGRKYDEHELREMGLPMPEEY